MDFHKETQQYGVDDPDIKPWLESERMIAATMIVQSFVDYHKSRKFINDEEVTYERYFDLPPYQKEIINLGREAKAWFLNKPRKHGTGWTLDRCCELLNYDPTLIRSTYLKPSTYAGYKKAKSAFGGFQMAGKPNNNGKGEKCRNAKISDKQVEEIRAKWRAGGVLQRVLADEYGISTTHVQRILRMESRA